jgi:hypothetical protein
MSVCLVNLYNVRESNHRIWWFIHKLHCSFMTPKPKTNKDLATFDAIGAAVPLGLAGLRRRRSVSVAVE